MQSSWQLIQNGREEGGKKPPNIKLSLHFFLSMSPPKCRIQADSYNLFHSNKHYLTVSTKKIFLTSPSTRKPAPSHSQSCFADVACGSTAPCCESSNTGVQSMTWAELHVPFSLGNLRDLLSQDSANSSTNGMNQKCVPDPFTFTSQNLRGAETIWQMPTLSNIMVLLEIPLP